jgi:glycerophosphoryl diester phosphodiesterase
MLTNVEIKQLDPPIEEQLVEMIEDHDMVEKVCLGSFDDGAAARLRELLPDACHYAPEDMARDYYIGTRAFITGWTPPPVDAFALPVMSGDLEVIDERMLDAIHKEGKFLWAWTIDEEAEMRRLLEIGVDGIMTNRPDLLDDLMDEMGLR